ncbi:hypothetical protein [Mycobacterium sp. AZCC_0083]|jgi:hypothetical protein|nr:hypothetical protein [Mycobacterium sp. AZCC_0083]MBB5168610.1 hypothetical protein [Mycobacterium sp. AZCC_0083]
MPVHSISTLHLLELRRTILAVAGTEPARRYMTELGLGLPRDPFLK